MKKKQYHKPSIETLSFVNLTILTGSDNVGLITGEGGNAAKYESSNLWDGDSEDEE